MKKQIKILKNLEGVEANCDQFQNIPTYFLYTSTERSERLICGFVQH